MGLLLTRHVDQYRIDICTFLCGADGHEHLRATGLEPFADQLAMKTIMFNYEHALHGRIQR